MDIVNPNYLNYMEQIQKNRKDIENLYEQELRDITQLNFKENDVNGLQYTNGKAIFNGKSTIIRDESIENLEVDSKVELKISSSDNNIVIGAGEDNSTLKIHLDNGTITTLDFAESERQKSKNLFKVNNVAGYSITRNGVTVTINDDYTITLNGTCTANTYFNLFNGINNGSTFSADYAKLYLDINKNYSYVLKQLSGSYSGTSTDNQIFGVSLRQTDGSAAVSGKIVELSIMVTGVNNTYVNKSGIDYLNNGYFRTTKDLTYDNFTFGLMICEGEDSDFQSWNGAIVHKKEIQDVEHIETIYDMSSSDSNINWGYTSGIRASAQVDGVLSFTSPIALNVNKKYRIYVNWGGDINIFTASVNQYGNRISGCSAVWADSLTSGELQMCEFYYLSDINQIQLRFRKLSPNVASIEIQTNEYVYITKIEEIY